MLLLLTEAYYYVSMDKDTKLNGLQVSHQIDYNSRFNPTVCYSACDEECKQLRADGNIPPATQEELNYAATTGEEIFVGKCFYQLQDGYEYIPENRVVICGCGPSYED